jgi:hypothetical protein
MKPFIIMLDVSMEIFILVLHNACMYVCPIGGYIVLQILEHSGYTETTNEIPHN